MGREIKFRAWDTETKEMSYDFLNKQWLRVCIESPYVELMQYTGLKDKNGREIYEGDIVTLNVPDDECVEVGNGWMDTVINKGFKMTGVVRFLYSSWFLDESDGKGCPLDFDSKQSIDICGNIYENPELLEV